MGVGGVLVDGAIGGAGLNGSFLASDTLVAPDGGVTARVGQEYRVSPLMTHAGVCVECILGVLPMAQLHSVQVFEGGEASVHRVLAGLRYALTLQARVVCLPWAIGRTRVEADLAELCRGGEEMGIVIVAAQPQQEPRPVPAAFTSVLAVSRCARRDPQGCSFAWSDSLRAVITPLPPSHGCALVAGLAMMYLDQEPAGNLSSFRECLDAFSRDHIPPLPEFVTLEERAQHLLRKLPGILSKAFMSFLGNSGVQP